MRNRKLLLLLESPDDLKYLPPVSASHPFVDVTGLIDMQRYPGLSRSGISRELGKLMPVDTYQCVFVIFPKREGESDKDWELRGWMHPVISIMTGGFTESIAATRSLLETSAQLMKTGTQVD